jgi:hypothetical protein
MSILLFIFWHKVHFDLVPCLGSPPPCAPVPAGGRAEVGGRRAAVGLGDGGERPTFCPRVVLTLLWGGGVGGGRAAVRLGEEEWLWGWGMGGA